jgi:hypothetical protein
VADGNHDGSAQESGTYQCFGDPNGGLRPLPRRQLALSQDIYETWPETGWPDPDTPLIAILDIALMSPVIDKARLGYPDPTEPADALFVSYFWCRDDDDATAYDRRAIGRQHKLYLDTEPPPTYDLWDYAETLSVDDLAVDAHLFLAYSMWFTSRAAYGIEDMEDPNINLIGLPQMRGMISVLPDNETSIMHRAFAYPANVVGIDPAADAVNAVSEETQDEKGEMGWYVGHQGRSVFGMRRTGSESDQFLEPFGLNGVMPVAEAVSWSDVNFAFAKFESNIFLDRTAFVEENPSGYGTFASVNANELFLVKHKGGGVVIRGSLNNPTVVKLAGVESIRGMMNIPAVTPEGCFYGTATGVWVWTGGDSSECMSPNLDGRFWETGPYLREYRPGLKGRFSYSYPFVYAPNDWVMDVRTKERAGGSGWFKLTNRIDESYPYMFYDTSWDDRVYAAPGAIDDTHSTVADVYDPDVLALDYQWRSQPFIATMNKDVEFKTVVLVAQGVGVVTVTVEGLDGHDPAVEQFTIDSPDTPVRFQKPTSIRATDPIVTLHSSVPDGETSLTASAPLIHAVHLGWSSNDTYTIPEDNNA